MRMELEIDSFELKDIFECGQCFRWNREENGSYTGVTTKCVINVEKTKSKIVFDVKPFSKMSDEDIKNHIIHYFDLDRDYSKLRKKIANVDDNLKVATKYGKGIRILNQELWETIISFIISANNNIPRIKGIIERMSEKYGKKTSFNGKTYYSFPTPKELSKATVEDLRKLGLGFRDKRIYETTKLIASGEVDLKILYKLNTADARDKLLELQGVGPKVADCILLFSDLKRFDVFPIDVWVRRVMNELYIHNKDENKVSKKEIEKIANEKFGDYKGLAQQYLFYWKREN